MRLVLLFLSSLLLILEGPAQEPEPAPEPTLAEELSALIERTNELETFHAVWRGPTEEYSLEMAYAAPDEGCLKLVRPGGFEEQCFDASGLYFRTAEQSWLHCELPYSEARERLDELFPTHLPLGPGFEFQFSSVHFRADGRAVLFWWLGWLKDECESVERQGDVLVATWDAGEAHVARDSGLPRRLTLPVEGEAITFELVQHSFDEKVVVTLPEDHEPAPFEDDHRAVIEVQYLDPVVRTAGFERVGALLASRKLTWDSSARSDWETCLVAIHNQQIQWMQLGWMKDLLAYVNEHLARVRATLERSDTPEVRAALAEYLDELERVMMPAFEEAPTAYLSEMFELTDPPEELLEAERDVVARLHDELITQPVLQYLREGREEILGQ